MYHRLVAVLGDDETVTHLGAECVHRHRAVDGKHHAGPQHRGVAGHQLRPFQETETGRAATAERVRVAGTLDDLGIGRMHRFSGHTGTQCVQRCCLAGNRDLVDCCLAGVRDLSDPEGAVEPQLEAVEIRHSAKTQKTPARRAA